MKFEVTSAKVTTQVGDQGSAQVLEQRFSDRDIEIVISGENINKILDKISNSIDKIFANNFEQYFNELFENPERFPPLNICIALLENQVLHTFCYGKTSVYLQRDGSLAKILVGSNKLQFASGNLKDKDKILLSAGDITEITATGVIRAILSSPISNFENKMSTILTRSSSSNGILAMQFDQMDVLPHKIEQTNDKFPVKEVSLVSPQSIVDSKPSIKGRVVGVLDLLISFVTTLQKPFTRNRSIGTIQNPVHTLEHEKKRKVAITVGVLILFILVTSIVFGVKQSKTRQYEQRFEEKITEIEHSVDEAYSLADINSQRSRELILLARDELQEVKDEGYEGEKLSSLTSRIENGIGELAGIYGTQADQYLDLTLISNGFVGNRLAYSDGRMLVLDQENDKLVEISIDSKRTQVLAGPDDISEAEEITLYSDESFVTVNGNIFKVKNNDVELSIGDEWNGDILISAFAGNMYVLDKGGSSIKRYPSITSGFGGGSEWLTEGVTPDFSNARKLAIDGYVWVLNGNSRILQFSRGNQINFSLRGFEGNLDNIDDLFLDEDTEYLYILDSSRASVFVFDKDGSFKAEYGSPDLSNAKQMIVSEEQKKLIFLTGEKLFEIELKHL